MTQTDSFDDLRDLYQEVILDHGRRPRHAHRLDAFDATAKGDNPMCGDRVQVWVKLDADTIGQIGFEARGCAISVASADLMAETVQGRDKADTRALFEAFRDHGPHRRLPGLRRRTGRTDGAAGAAVRRPRISVPGEVRDASLACPDRRAGRREGGKQ